MTLKLKQFRVTDFRSIVNSGSVELDDVTGLVGINESGKSNLLLALWKLNPARDGEIEPMADYPRDRYHEIRKMEQKPTFITAQFVVGDTLARQIATKTGLPAGQFDVVEVSRNFDGEYDTTFPNCIVPRTMKTEDFKAVLEKGRKELNGVSAYQLESELKDEMLAAIESAENAVGNGKVGAAELEGAIAILDIERESKASTSKIVPVFDDLVAEATRKRTTLTREEPGDVDGVWQLIDQNMPEFLYYSNYGNLDSEIYLPHVIENLDREGLGQKEAAKSRTLKVLFEFVKLKPQEILDLGRESPQQELSPDQIEAEAKRKKEREILLQSASTQLTKKFKDWWKQGDYIFRFQADGNHFRIWVSDDIRPEPIELEGRSTGLQWFFSFYLVFLVESQNSHKNVILLLDEAGLSLHPLAQRDLSVFFENLPNQIVYTTHSPFLMEADALDQVRSVFVDEAGRTVVSPNLRADPKIPTAEKSIYPVHVAMGLSVSDTFLIGCLPIVVEGVSDQRYLTGIKNYLIGKGRIQPSKDIVFLPAGGTGTKGVAAVVSIVTAKEEELPSILIDSDRAGADLKTRLCSGTYQSARDRVRQVGDYGVVADGEIEDLMPTGELASVITRYLPRPAGSADDFEDVVDSTKPIVPQVEAYCDSHGIELEIGWKVEVATQFKKRLRKLSVNQAIEDRWTKVFEDFLAES